ncbi:hypothetical protein K505DRAFT_359423 [Melanomma pulvis-pyrius CBS 109.77]|uniref:Zn(2)-C6 fungal-type domain-containing protein n=1 Tax=Melanomma pulvis-pyrius CBS 109.77 TaxID=1314802 RepID=A0A6A6XKB2_9PLEO|nr:hypothetical protein K505DRAFT_359423 [Melanomma pulvis-pyrius CBS 109.77]
MREDIPQYANSMAQLSSSDRVINWLERLAIETRPIAKEDRSEREEKIRPTTPSRARQVSEFLDEASPTNTSSSYDNVFDSPKINVTGRGDHDYASSDTSVTSTGEDDPNCEICDRECAEEDIDVVMPEEALDEYSAWSLDSYTPPTEISVDINPDAHPYSNLAAPPPLDFTQPRLVWVTSCLQCIYAGLPCSRNPPTCSRCKRAGYGDMCLLRRRKVCEELVRGEGVKNVMPVLLRLKEEDEGVWERKVELSRELHQIWLNKQDRKNWVLPMSGKKVTREGYVYSKYQVPHPHPGEGLGRHMFRELHLA